MCAPARCPLVNSGSESGCARSGVCVCVLSIKALYCSLYVCASRLSPLTSSTAARRRRRRRVRVHDRCAISCICGTAVKKCFPMTPHEIENVRIVAFNFELVLFARAYMHAFFCFIPVDCVF